MKLQMTKIGFLLLFGAFTSTEGSTSTTQSKRAASTSITEGVTYRHSIESSRFNVGVGERQEVQGPYERFVGGRGAFMVDTVTGSTLAVLNAPAGGVYPSPLTENADEHSAAVRDYLVAAGVPVDEISGTHVTTTMAGSGPTTGGVQQSRSKLLWYTTHLERSLGGIPVEGSFAFAALDRAGEVITEGVYWPSISAEVVSKAQVLRGKLSSDSERTAFLANVAKARPDVGNASGEVKIVHTSAGHHGTFEAKAVYSVVVRGAIRGKAQIVSFDDTGARVVLADQLPGASDSVKKQ